MRRFIERVLPWFDAEREAEKDRRVAAVTARSQRLAAAIRTTGDGLRSR